jgi:hypothetical protein
MVATANGSPLSTAERRTVERLGRLLREQILAYLARPQNGTERFMIAANLSTRIGRALDAINDTQLPLVRRRLRLLLDQVGTATDHRTTRPLCDNLTLITVRHAAITHQLQEKLDIAVPNDGFRPEATDDSVQQHHFRYASYGLTRQTGIRFPVGINGGIGRCIIEETHPDPWTHTYWMVALGVSASLGI